MIGQQSLKSFLYDREKGVEDKLESSWPVIAFSLDSGIIFVADNEKAKNGVRKLSSIYDNIIFGAGGDHVAFDALRRQLIENALRIGNIYSRNNVHVDTLITGVSNTIYNHLRDPRAIPLIVEIILAEMHEAREQDKIFKINFRGEWKKFTDFAVIGYKRKEIKNFIEKGYKSDMSVDNVVEMAKDAFLEARRLWPQGKKGKDKAILLEVAVLSRIGKQFIYTENGIQRG